jgi:hypothetical protein
VILPPLVFPAYSKAKKASTFAPIKFFRQAQYFRVMPVPPRAHLRMVRHSKGRLQALVSNKRLVSKTLQNVLAYFAPLPVTNLKVLETLPLGPML